MKTFKQFYTKPAEFIAFSNAGGKEGQYDRFDYTESFMYGQGGGPKTSLDENLNPRANPEYIQSKSNTFFDPERNALGLAEDHNTPRNLGIPDYHRNGYVHPHYTNEQTADPRRNQRRSSPCHSCIVSKISQVLKDKNEAQRFLQYHFTKH